MKSLMFFMWGLLFFHIFLLIANEIKLIAKHSLSDLAPIKNSRRSAHCCKRFRTQWRKGRRKWRRPRRQNWQQSANWNKPRKTERKSPGCSKWTKDWKECLMVCLNLLLLPILIFWSEVCGNLPKPPCIYVFSSLQFWNAGRHQPRTWKNGQARVSYLQQPAIFFFFSTWHCLVNRTKPPGSQNFFSS